MARDRNQKYTIAVWFFCLTVIASISAYYFADKYMIKIVAYQEFHKAVIALSAIFLAFSPAFYALLYSNPSLQERIRNLRIKDALDSRFRFSTISAFILTMSSLIGVVVSYTLDSVGIINICLFAFVVGALVSTSYWTLQYGRLALRIIAHLMR